MGLCYQDGLTLMRAWIRNYAHYQSWNKSHYPSQKSTMQTFMFGNGLLVSPSTIHYDNLSILRVKSKRQGESHEYQCKKGSIMKLSMTVINAKSNIAMQNICAYLWDWLNVCFSVKPRQMMWHYYIFQQCPQYNYCLCYKCLIISYLYVHAWATWLEAILCHYSGHMPIRVT